MAGVMSDMKSDVLFVNLMRLLNSSSSIDIRKRIIKSMNGPYSEVALAFMGKRLRDESPDVCTLIFNQLIASHTQLKDFPSPETRMLVLTEGLCNPNPMVRDACIEFLTPTILENQDNLAHVFSILNCKLAFTNQYFARIPCLLVIAIHKILPSEMQIAKYL